MEVKSISPPNNGFLQVKLDPKNIAHLWNIIDIAKAKNINYNANLAGNISQSLLLNDLDSFFYKSVCIPLINLYRDKNSPEGDPVSKHTLIGPNSKLVLNQLWVNYQYKTEFNPYHDHSGVYSFAIWMKIPYEWEDQIKLPQFSDIERKNRKAGNFEFEYIDCLGRVRTFGYNLSPKFEGYMIFFPAKLRHCVYPFYETDEPRISIAGNLSYLPA